MKINLLLLQSISEMTYIQAVELSHTLSSFFGLVLITAAVQLYFRHKICEDQLHAARDHAWFWENECRQSWAIVDEIERVSVSCMAGEDEGTDVEKI